MTLSSRLGIFDPSETIVLTNDKKLIARIQAHGPFTCGTSLEAAAYSLPAATREIRQPVLQVLVKNSMVPDMAIRLRYRTAINPLSLWSASL